MTARPFFSFFTPDWRADPALRMCSLAARGLWVEMLCIMHESEPRGFLLINGKGPSVRQLAFLVGVREKEVTEYTIELENAGVFSRDDNRLIYSRRMVRDEEKARKDKANGYLGGSPDLIGGIPRGDRFKRLSRKDNPSKVEEVWVTCGGICTSCAVPMQRQNPNAPDAFTIDHIKPLARGGGNETSNLQALCRSCNRRKGITPTEENSASGDKANLLSNTHKENPDADASGAEAPIDPSIAEREFFTRGRQVGGKSCGGLLSQILKTRGNNVALARAVIELASTKEKPLEYLAKAAQGPPQGVVTSTLKDRKKQDFQDAYDQLADSAYRDSGSEESGSSLDGLLPAIVSN